MPHRHAFLISIVSVLFLFNIVSCKYTTHLADTSTATLRVTNTATDSTLLRLTEPYRNKMDAKMNEVLATTEQNLVKDKPESTLTNWVADAIYNQSKKHFSEPIDFAYQNYGGIRIPNIGKGSITLGTIFELMPFDNMVVLLKMPAKELLQFANYIAEADGAPVSSSVKMVIQNKKLLSLAINGIPVTENDTKIYHLILPDYIANGGDNLSYLFDNEKVIKTLLIRDLLAAEAKEQGILKTVLDKRIEVK